MPKLLQSIVRENEVISIVYYAESKTVLTLLISLWDWNGTAKWNFIFPQLSCIFLEPMFSYPVLCF